MNRRLLVLLVSAASVVAIASPAGAASSKHWTQVKIPCASGNKSAVIGYSPTHPWWGPSDENGAAELNPKRWASWYKNPCKGQWLITETWHGDPSDSSVTVWSIATGKSGRLGGAESARLSDAPVCDAGGADLGIIAKPKQAATVCR